MKQAIGTFRTSTHVLPVISAMFLLEINGSLFAGSSSFYIRKITLCLSVSECMSIDENDDKFESVRENIKECCQQKRMKSTRARKSNIRGLINPDKLRLITSEASVQ